MRVPVRVVTVSLAAALAAVPVAASDWSFAPAVEVGAERSDNLRTLGSDGEPGEWGTAYTAALDLGLVRTNPRSELRFAYRPFLETFEDNSELDNTSHRVSADWSLEASRRTEWDARLSWSRRERQRLTFEDPDLDQVALPGRENDTLSGSLGTTMRTGKKTRVSLRANHVSNSYEESGAGSDPRIRLQDSRSTLLSADFGYSLSEHRSVGLALSAGRTDDGDRGELDTYQLVGSYSWTGRNDLSIDLTLGATAVSIRDTGVDAAGDPLPEYDEPVELTGSFGVDGRLSRYVTLNGGIARQVSDGVGVSGSVTSLSAFTACDVRLRRSSSLRFSARYAQRDEIRREEAAAGARPAADTTSYRAEWRAGLSESWQLVLSGERFDQSSDDSGNELLNVDYTIYGLSIRWAPETGRR